MVEKRKPVHFRVHYKLRDKPEKVIRDYLMRDRPELMRMMWKEEGITVGKCEFMYIHMRAHDGQIVEVLSYDQPNKDQPPVRVTSLVPATVVPPVEVVLNTKKHALNRYTFTEAK